MAKREFLISSSSELSVDPVNFSFPPYKTSIRIIPAMPVIYISLAGDRYGVGEDIPVPVEERSLIDTHFSDDAEVIKRPGYLQKVTIFTDPRREDASKIDTLRHYGVVDGEGTDVKLRFINREPIFPETVNCFDVEVMSGGGLSEYLACLENHNNCVIETMEQLDRFLLQSEKENKNLLS